MKSCPGCKDDSVSAVDGGCLEGHLLLTWNLAPGTKQAWPKTQFLVMYMDPLGHNVCIVCLAA